MRPRSGMRLSELDDRRLEARWPAGLNEVLRLPEPDQLANASIYQCLAEAVRNEQKAFRFYSYLAANARDEALSARAGVAGQGGISSRCLAASSSACRLSPGGATGLGLAVARPS